MTLTKRTTVAKGAIARSTDPHLARTRRRGERSNDRTAKTPQHTVSRVHPVSPPIHRVTCASSGHVGIYVIYGMARHHGMPGRTLFQGVVGLTLVPVAIGFGVYFIFGSMHPMLRVAAPIIGIWAIVAVLRSRSFEKEFVAKARGAIGEATVGHALHRLPTGWRVFHDVQLGNENIDHVVVSNRGVFTIEVKNYSGTIKAEPSGIYTHGQRNDRIVRQAWRQAHRLRALLGVDVQPVLVFVGRDFGRTRVGSLPVMPDFALVPWLLDVTERKLDLHTGRRVFAMLESMVTGRPLQRISREEESTGVTEPMGQRASTSNQLQVYWISSLPTLGALGLTFAANVNGQGAVGFESGPALDVDLARLRMVYRADALVSLLERREYGLLHIPDLLERATAEGLGVHQFAIPEASVPPPEDAAAFDALVAGIRSELDKGKRIVLHCRHGCGRSGLVAAVVITTFGDSAEAAIVRLRMAYPEALATQEQEAYVADRSGQMRAGSRDTVLKTAPT